jgi:hypothetical protein
MRLACCRAADKNKIALLLDEAAAGKVANQGLVDRDQMTNGLDAFARFAEARRRCVFGAPLRSE